MKRLFIIHGWEAAPTAHWFPWLKREAEARGFFVDALEMPNTEHPTLEGWLGHLQKSVGTLDEKTYFVGHSLGCIAILRYLEALLEGQRAGGAILVAGFSEPIEFEELNSFFPKLLDYEKVRRSVGKIIAFQSSNDRYVPMRYGEILRDRLGAELIVIRNAGHFNTNTGFIQFPQVLEVLLRISQ
jgi:predicted alpha/beta hydrolase family esterase